MTRFSTAQQAEVEVTRLTSVIADALAAMDEGRMGDVRRILKTGKADAVKPVSIVLAKGGTQ